VQCTTSTAGKGDSRHFEAERVGQVRQLQRAHLQPRQAPDPPAGTAGGDGRGAGCAGGVAGSSCLAVTRTDHRHRGGERRSPRPVEAANQRVAAGLLDIATIGSAPPHRTRRCAASGRGQRGVPKLRRGHGLHQRGCAEGSTGCRCRSNSAAAVNPHTGDGRGPRPQQMTTPSTRTASTRPPPSSAPAVEPSADCGHGDQAERQAHDMATPAPATDSPSI